MSCDLDDVLGGLYKPGMYDLDMMLSAIGERMVKDAVAVYPKQLGLDCRAAAQLYIGDDFIAVSSGDDRMLQYYGGFEYVDKDCRRECGGYVFYSNEDERVQEHMDRLNETDEETEEE